MTRKILLSVAVFFISLCVVELYCRSQPLSRVQRVNQLSNHTLRMIGDVPVWKSKNPVNERVANAVCLGTAQNGPDVYLVGDSIFYGASLDPDDTLAPVLQGMLTSQLQRNACVVNLSEPGFAFANEEAVLREAVSAHKPRVVVLELWANSPNRFRVLNGVAYNFGQMETDDHGFPNPGVPDDLNRALFGRSALWRHVSTGLAATHSAPVTEAWTAFVDGQLEPLRVWLEGQGIELVLAYATSLRTPFADGRPKESPAYGIARSWAQEHGILEVVFSEVLVNEDPQDVGIDACCHLNAKGMRLVSEAIASPVVDLLQSE